MIPLIEFETAYHRISPYIVSTPTVRSEWLSSELNADIYLKLECLQPGRSFKIRGATNALLSQRSLPTRVLTASGGNHGLGVAIASKKLHVPCTVVLPTSTSSYRIKLLKDAGAEVVLEGNTFDDANDYAVNLATKEGILYIHPFADREVMIGQGTIALELVNQIQDFDVLTASVGGGGLLGGISLALEAMNISESIELFAVETKGTESMALSLQNNTITELPSITSIAKTLGARKTTQFIFETFKRLIDHCFVIDDSRAVDALFQFIDNEKLLVEPATSCLIAAALDNKEYFTGKKCVFIICGSNVSLSEIFEWKKQFNIDYQI